MHLKCYENFKEVHKFSWGIAKWEGKKLECSFFWKKQNKNKITVDASF